MATLTNILTHRKRLVITAVAALTAMALSIGWPSVAHAAGVDEETSFVLNTFAFLIWGALVMWMCAGFTMLESGSVRTKNASMICLKNIGLYSIAGLAYFVIGYNLMYGETVGGIIGSFNLLYGSSADELALLASEDAGMTPAMAEQGYSTMSDWFFQMVFVATAASIVSGALAERVKMWSFLLFTLLLTAIIYPIVGAWTWGGGWLADLGFQDFAGSSIVHSTGGWAALAGMMVVGPRLGKFRKDGSARPTPPSNILVVTLGVFILWFGWFGFNGGSQLAVGSATDAVAMSIVLVNTNLAAAAGVMAALMASRPLLGRVDLFAGLNGAIAGLVSITAAPDIAEPAYRHPRPPVGDNHRRHRRRNLRRRAQAAGEGQARRRGRRGARPPVRRRLGHLGRKHHGRREAPHPAARHSRDWGVRLRGRPGRSGNCSSASWASVSRSTSSAWVRMPGSWAWSPTPNSCSCPSRTTTTKTSAISWAGNN